MAGARPILIAGAAHCGCAHTAKPAYVAAESTAVEPAASVEAPAASMKAAAAVAATTVTPAVRRRRSSPAERVPPATNRRCRRP